MKVAFYDAKPYDKEFFSACESGDGIEFVFHPFRFDESTAGTAKGCDAVCVFVNDQLNASSLQALAKEDIKHVTLRCAGFNNVDLDEAAGLGIIITRVPAYSPHAVAEHAVALLQTLNRKVHRAYNRVREHNFSLEGLVGFDLHGKTAGIIGTGKIGKITAQIFRGFGMEVLAQDPFPDQAWADENGVSYRELDEIYTSSDVISLHAPLTAETHYLVDEEALAAMKPGAILINTSRGKLIETGALIKALKEKRIGGVALDVYEVEEGVFFEDYSREILEDDDLARLVSFPNVLLTSHQGFLTDEALAEISRVTCENLQRGHRGEDFLEGTIVSAE